MKQFINILFFLFSSIATAQEYYDIPYIYPDHEFINLDSNHLYFPGDSSKFEVLNKKFDRLMFEGKGQINMLQVGGSHIQADLWSGRIRQRFLNYFPGAYASRGFVFPFKMAKTNNPYNYYLEWDGKWQRCRNVSKIDCQLGMAGIRVLTEDSLTNILVTTRGRLHPQYEFDRVKVFHNVDSTSFCLSSSDTNLVAIVKDTSSGFTEFIFREPIDTFRLQITQLDTTQENFTLYGMLFQNNFPGVYYHGIGVNGASTPSYLRCDDFEKQLQTIKPDVVVFSIGINDAYTNNFDQAKYEANYDTLISWVKSVNPDASIILTSNNDSYFKVSRYRKIPNRNAFQVRDAMIRLAKKHGCAFWDMFTVMGGLDSVAKWEKEKLAKRDKIHFTLKGYLLVGDLLFGAIAEKYEAHIRQNVQP